MKKQKLVIVFGPPRTGTSLHCDFLSKLGFNLGVVKDYSEEKRSSRNDLFEFFGGAFTTQWHVLEKKIIEQNITATKLVHNVGVFIPKLIEKYDVYWIITTRNKIETDKSQTDNGTIPQHERTHYHLNYKIAKELLLNEKIFISPFELILKKDSKHLQQLIDFLEIAGNVNDLVELIDVGAVKYLPQNHEISYVKDIFSDEIYTKTSEYKQVLRV